jgi:hypothetical protein
MAKIQKKSPAKPNLSKRKYILLALVALIVVLTTSYLGYRVYLDNADAKKFASLKSDMQNLQTRFNRINSGWQYSEGCQETGSPFGEGIKSCTVNLAFNGRTDNFNKATEYIEAVKSNLHIKNEVTRNYISDEGNKVISFGFDESEFSESGSCALRMEENKKESTLSCTYEAREKYFLEYR